MQFPERMPGLKWLTIIIAVYGIIWISLEGALIQVLLFSAGLTILSAGYIVQKHMAGRKHSLGGWLILCAAIGCLAGLTFGLLALILMAVKTGLHGHGPEFSPVEVSWVAWQIPWWAASGLIAGAGLGLLAVGFAENRDRH